MPSGFMVLHPHTLLHYVPKPGVAVGSRTPVLVVSDLCNELVSGASAHLDTDDSAAGSQSRG